ncbi:hypothetical protein ACFWIB_40785 [Streptomyces sp. NPDC127051]|uniref:hypothetical protein n=1 Tax=Streptomyces sp. NPDC127051 TaxID=3347119 RepID=UPI00364AB9A2
MIHASRTLQAAAAMTAAVVFGLLTAGVAANSGDSRTVGHVLNVTSPDGHPLRQVPADAAPKLTLKVSKDSVSGWNLHLVTEAFIFAPEHAGGPVQANEGHAHVYVDGRKIARVYGPWFHVPAEAVPEGKHTLSASLTANDHTVWAVANKIITAEVEITGGASDGAAHAHKH